MPQDRARLGSLQLRTAGSVDNQVDNRAFLPRGSSSPARHRLAITLYIDESRMRCNHQGVQINARAIDLFPRMKLTWLW